MKKRLWDKIKDFIDNDFLVVVVIAIFISFTAIFLTQAIFSILGV